MLPSSFAVRRTLQGFAVGFKNIQARPGLLRYTSTSTSQGPRKMEELQQNPFFNKYSSKLAELQRTKPDEFLKKVEENKTAKKALEPKQESSTPSEAKPSETAASRSSLPVYNKQRQLKDIMKIELLQGRPVKEISEIWTTYHKDKEGFLSAVAPTSMYKSIMQRAAQFPVFLYPLPRAGGYEFFVAEFHGNECYFTQLISFQTRQADAPPCLCVIHFEDFQNEGVILMRGEFDHNVLNPLEVQCLLNQMQLYYGTDDQQKIKLIETFNKNPDGFKHMDLVSEVEHSFTALK